MLKSEAVHDPVSVNPIDLYWREIKDTVPLSRDMEVELFQRARAGDDEARQQLITANLRFVVSIAREYREYGISLSELVSEGNIGLLEAIQRFDETRGFKFITYAVWWIRQAILKALAQNGKISRPPMSQVNDLQKIDKQTARLAQQLGRAPTYDEICACIDLSDERTRNALEVSQHDLSLDAPIYPDDDTALIHSFAVEQESVDRDYEKKQMQRTLTGCLDILDPREYQILRAYFGLEDTRSMTLDEIGDLLGVTRERVRQLRNRALSKIRTHWGELLCEFSSN